MKTYHNIKNKNDVLCCGETFLKSLKQSLSSDRMKHLKQMVNLMENI
jgi:hypothetical protein